MNKVNMTFLPSARDDFSKDQLIIDWCERLKDTFDFINIYIPKNIEEAKENLSNSNAAYGVITEDLIDYCDNIKWLQAPQAAPPPNFYFKKLIDHPVLVTNFRGIYNDHISHHIMAMILSFSRSLNLYISQQAQRKWSPLNLELSSTRYLPESRILIIGVGGIGEETSKLCKSFGSEVIGVDERRIDKPDYIEKLLKPSEMENYLDSSDFIVSTIPHTPNTEKIFNYDFFSKMKKSAFFINIGRGKTTVLDDLALAIKNKKLSGAGLDVFEQEPLPENHELWEMKNVIITPHVAAYDVPYLNDRRYEIIKNNCINFKNGKSLINVVDKNLWY